MGILSDDTIVAWDARNMAFYVPFRGHGWHLLLQEGKSAGTFSIGSQQ